MDILVIEAEHGKIQEIAVGSALHILCKRGDSPTDYCASHTENKREEN